MLWGIRLGVRPTRTSFDPGINGVHGHIVQVSQDFTGLAWVRYDTAFCRQDTLTQNDHWSVINSTLYTTYVPHWDGLFYETM